MDKPMVFSKQWFGKHQNKLLFLLNNKFTRFIFRKIMRIDCKKDILALLPNSYIIKGSKKDEYIADFRTHDKYAKRLYYAFKPLWYIIHAFDTLFANKWIPEWNLGFDTLTVYPSAGTSGTTCDGTVTRIPPAVEYLSEIRIGDGTSYDTIHEYGDIVRIVAAEFSVQTNKYQMLRRYIFTLDTSSLTAFAQISSAVFSIYGYSGSTTNGLGSTSMDICSSTPNSNNNIQSSDFSQFGVTSFGNIDYDSYSTSGYNNITLNSSGISNISKTGVSKFGAKLGWDINNSSSGLSWGASKETKFGGFFADYLGTSQDPKLVVTYTLATFIPQILFM